MFYILHILCILFFIPGLILTIPLHVLAYVSKRGQKKQLAELKGIRQALEHRSIPTQPGDATEASKAPAPIDSSKVKAILWIALIVLMSLAYSGYVK